ncbi:Chitin synthase regulatory factor 3 [Cytospora mali]|uniref:Chitin synthase regulatory factor 3 n=1 Tax=Cytospora mali TaxID=578113 RepID=A0A194VDR3_CYTMA|nr:Chitin synthase regulatory factor 3 [Valsa mali var. pyri (nom. inval.)]
MAYNGGFPAQRPLNGPGAPRQPPQRQYPAGPAPPQQYDQQYDQYQDDYGYGYEGYAGDGGYDQGYGGQYDDGNYGARAPPPRDPYGPSPSARGRGPPMNGGRGGGPMQRPPMTNGQRGPPGPPGPGRPYPPNGAMGRGRPAHVASPNSDPNMNRSRQPPMPPQKSPGQPGFGDSPFPTFPGQHRKTNLDQEQQIISQMGAINIDSQRKGPKGRAPTRGASMDDYGPRPSMDSHRSPPGPPRNYPPQAYPDQRRGPPPDLGEYGDYHQPAAGASAGRTMTMPSSMGGMPVMAPPPARADSAPYGGPVGRGMPQPRPSTSQGNRAPPQRMYASNQGPPAPTPVPTGGYGGQGYDDYDQGYGPEGYGQGGYGEYYDEYYDDGGANGYGQPPPPEPDMPNFDAAPRGRSSLDLSLQSGPIDPQRAPGRMPGLNSAKSQPDLRQPQQTVFEMASDAPPMPPMGGQGGYGPRMNGASPPQTVPGFPSNPMPLHPGHQQAPPSSNPDSLPSHPAPVRAGHMPGSVVNRKPAPVRNYGAAATPAPATQSSPAPRVQPKSEPPVSMDELERLRNIVKANPQDQQNALRLAKKLIEAADVLVPSVPDPKSRQRARERYIMDAQKVLKKLSNAGNSEAMFTLADGFGKGLFGSVPDNKEAFTMYQSAAKLGHAAAAYRTAVCCEIGNEEGGGTRKDPLKAIQWYKRAAMLGDTPAMYKVGMILLKGLLGQPKNPREAIGWLKRAAESADAENPHALHELGLLYQSAGPNDVILKDEAYAFTLFKQAAELGYKFSQFRLGCAYEYGLLGCPIDPRLSIMWYSKAAEQGEHQSELALSGWYLTGSDNVLGQNDTEAYLWARKAAMAGLAKAEYAMGYFTEMGIGVPANQEDAKRWYWRAAAQDFPQARERLEELKRSGKNGPRPRELITRSHIREDKETVLPSMTMQQAEAAGHTSAYRGVPARTGSAIGRRPQTPGPGPMGRPGTPTPMPPLRQGVRAVKTGSLGPSRSQSRSDLVRERYQALEEQQRSTGLQRTLSRPVLLSSVRSFSYEYPTQAAEMERMGNLHSSSPPRLYEPPRSAPPDPESGPSQPAFELP